MYVFRIHIRPQGGTASVEEAFEYCLKNKILGVGWKINSTKTPNSWGAYLEEAKQIYKNMQGVEYIKRWVSEGDLVWTRDDKANYYLARVISGWEYWIGDEAIEKDIDIANIFRVELHQVSLEAVPGKVIACFRATRTIQEVASKPTIEYTKFLWNNLSKNNDYLVDKNVASDIFELMNDEETEDVIFLYMQKNDWFIVPNSRKKDTMRYEFYAVNPKTRERAVTQVKTGKTEINRDNYANSKEKVFLFQSQEKYSGSNYENVTCLSRQQILEFMNASSSWLPTVLQRKMDLSKALSSL